MCKHCNLSDCEEDLQGQNMAGYRMNKRLLIIAAGVLVVSVVGWLKLLLTIGSYELKPKPIPVHQLKMFSIGGLSYEESRKTCLGLTSDETLLIGMLDDVIGRWSIATSSECRELYGKFIDIYSVTRRAGQVIIPDTFQTKVLKWLNNDEELFKEVKLQFITSIFNKYTHESAIFNPLRSKRPGVSGDEEIKEYVEEQVKKSEKDCDFCAYQFKTAEDTFGRIESEHSATAANTFKYDAYHALVIMKSHSPLDFSEVQFLDMMDTAMKWFMKVHEMDKNYKYPHLMWDNLSKASASQIHPHAQASVGPVRHYGLMEHIHLEAMEYSRSNNGNNYFTDLVQIHKALGLTTSLGSATAMAYITPKKDNEVIILSKTPSKDFFQLLYYTIRAYMDDLQLYAWSLAMFLPKLEPYGKPTSDDIPAIVRIISRGPANNPRNDISAMELFAAQYSLCEHYT
ncbi:uncharacterized protein [Ptychodera flava]|uniref:uncharacterized protein isoform X2 n=1 Tax=Ptychodera flava TaxID=63121 RepID=UPI003969F172